MDRSFQRVITAAPRPRKMRSSSSTRAVRLSRSFLGNGRRAPPSLSHLARALLDAFGPFASLPVIHGIWRTRESDQERPALTWVPSLQLSEGVEEKQSYGRLFFGMLRSTAHEGDYRNAASSSTCRRRARL